MSRHAQPHRERPSVPAVATLTIAAIAVAFGLYSCHGTEVLRAQTVEPTFQIVTGPTVSRFDQASVNINSILVRPLDPDAQAVFESIDGSGLDIQILPVQGAGVVQAVSLNVLAGGAVTIQSIPLPAGPYELRGISFGVPTLIDDDPVDRTDPNLLECLDTIDVMPAECTAVAAPAGGGFRVDIPEDLASDERFTFNVSEGGAVVQIGFDAQSFVDQVEQLFAPFCRLGDPDLPDSDFRNRCNCTPNTFVAPCLSFGSVNAAAYQAVLASVLSDPEGD